LHNGYAPVIFNKVINFQEGAVAKKIITIREFADELKKRLQDGKTVDCCKNELLSLAEIIREKIGDEKIEVDWKE
jgi:hypothetical protein